MTDREIFTRIWAEPRTVFRYINETRHQKYVIILLVLAGIITSINRASDQNFGDRMGLWEIASYAIVLGALFGWISYYIGAALVSWTGQWLGGKADVRSMVRMVAYAAIPSILSIVFIIPGIIVYGVDMFSSEGILFNGGWLANITVFGAMVAEIALAVYSIVLLVIAISEVQKFSIGKAILNLFLPALLLLGLVLLFVFVFRLT